jgi:methyltransferase (TIGR00027 family)
LFTDPFASRFVHGDLRALVTLRRIPALGRLAPHVYDRIGGPGLRASAIARTRSIDDAMSSAAAAGTRQFVLLGAGYDCRAYRLDALATSSLFEVDHPTTQAAKRSVIGHVDLEVTFVGVDFEHDALGEALTQAGFDTARPTFHLWEGVTNYLTAGAVDRTLAVIRQLSGAPSRLVFTYVDRGVIDGSRLEEFPKARRWLDGVRRAGEPWNFGLRPDELADFLHARGYRLISDVSTLEAGEPYFRAARRREHGSGSTGSS